MDSWRSIQGTRLSNDGQWLAYALTAQGEDGELIVRNVAQRPGIQAARAARRPSFTPDGKFVVFTIAQTKADEEREAPAESGPAEPERRGRKAPARDGPRRRSAARDAAHRPRHHDAAGGRGDDDREGRQLPSAGRVVGVARLLQGRRRNRRRRARRRRRTWRARRRRTQAGPAAPPAPAAASAGRRTPEPRQRTAREAQGSRLGSHPPQPRDRRRDHDPRRHRVRRGTRRATGSPTRPRRPTRPKDGAFARRIERRHASRRCSPDAATTRASRSTRPGTQLAFLSDQAEYDEAGVAVPPLLLEGRRRAGGRDRLGRRRAGMPKGMVVSDIAAPRFSKDGERLYLGDRRRRRRRRPIRTTRTPAPIQVDLWTLRGSAASSRCRRSATDQERQRSYRAVVHLARQAVRAARDAGPADREPGRRSRRARSARPTCRTGRRSRGTRPTTTSTCVDLKTGKPKKVLEHWGSAGTTLSPGGKYLLYFDERTGHWFTLPHRRRRAREPHREAAREVPAGERHARPAGPVRRRRLDGRRQVASCSTTSSTSGKSSPTAPARAW